MPPSSFGVSSPIFIKDSQVSVSGSSTFGEEPNPRQITSDYSQYFSTGVSSGKLRSLREVSKGHFEIQKSNSWDCRGSELMFREI